MILCPYEVILLSNFNEQAGTFTSYWAKNFDDYNPKDKEASLAVRIVVNKDPMKKYAIRDYGLWGCYVRGTEDVYEKEGKILLPHLSATDAQEIITEFLQEQKRTEAYETSSVIYNLGCLINSVDPARFSPIVEGKTEKPFIARTEQIFVPPGFEPDNTDDYSHYSGRTFNYLRYRVAAMGDYPVLKELTTPEALEEKFGKYIYPTQGLILATDVACDEKGELYTVTEEQKQYTPTTRGYSVMIGQAHKMIKLATFESLGEALSVTNAFRENAILPKFQQDPALRGIPSSLYANHVGKISGDIVHTHDKNTRFTLG